MTKLTEDGLTVEIKFTSYNYGYVHYSFDFTYENEPYFNPSILTENPITACEHGADNLIPTIEDVLKENCNDSWEAMEPEIEIIFRYFQTRGWKETQANKNILHVSEEEKKRLKNIDYERERHEGKLADDTFRILFLLDNCKLKGPDRGPHGPYRGKGPALLMDVSRQTLTMFLESFKKEYQAFLETNKEMVREIHKEWGKTSPV